ncbi:MAG: hypothetical protein ACWA5K_03665 [bacterium]
MSNKQEKVFRYLIVCLCAGQIISFFLPWQYFPSPHTTMIERYDLVEGESLTVRGLDMVLDRAYGIEIFLLVLPLAAVVLAIIECFQLRFLPLRYAIWIGLSANGFIAFVVASHTDIVFTRIEPKFGAYLSLVFIILIFLTLIIRRFTIGKEVDQKPNIGAPTSRV